MQTHHRNRKRIIYLTPNPTTTPHSPQISSTLPKRKTEETKESFFGSHPESVPIYQSWETRPKQEQPQILQRIKWVLLSLWNWEVLDIVILMEEVGSICMWYSQDLIHRERERGNLGCLKKADFSFPGQSENEREGASGPKIEKRVREG